MDKISPAARSRNMSNYMNQLIFLDTETTGNDLLTDHLFEVCYLQNGKIIAETFKPPVPISVKAQSITHITNKMVADKPSFADSQMKKELHLLFQDHILVAHNAKFDIAMLAKEGVEVTQYICTLKVTRFLDEDNLIPEHNLQYLRYHHELEIDDNAHDAESDVKVLEGLFKKLYDLMFETLQDKEKVIAKMIEISKTPFLVKTFGFGKYKGLPVKEIYYKDKDYLLWLLTKMETDDRDNDDWIYTLKHHLQIKN